MIIKKIIDGVEREIELTQEEITAIVLADEWASACEDLKDYVEENKDGIVLTDEQKDKIVDKYLDYLSDDDGWLDALEQAYNYVMCDDAQ